MVAAARARVPAIVVELFGPQPRLPRIFVQRGRDRYQLVPVPGRRRVDFDHAGVGCDLEMVQSIVGRRRIPLNYDGRSEVGRRRFGSRDQFQVILQTLDRRQKHVQRAIARFDAQRRPHHFGRTYIGRRRAHRLLLVNVRAWPPVRGISGSAMRPG